MKICASLANVLLALSVAVAPSSGFAAPNKAALRPAVPRATIVSAARAEVTKDFLDPAGAQLRDVTIWNIGRGNVMFTVCGEVNGKNSYGAFTGFKRFMVSITNAGNIRAYNARVETEGDGTDYQISETCKEGKYQPSWKM